jgi:uncharacterized protein
MPNLINGLVVKIAQRCNLNCSYCYMYNHQDQSFRSRPVFMSHEVFRALCKRIRSHCESNPGHTISVVLHGGEPMLFDPHTLDSWMNAEGEALTKHARFGMQTNASLVSDAWIDVMKRHSIHPGVSLDGPPEIHDLERIDHAGKGSYDKTIDGLRRLIAAGLDPGLLCVINPKHSGIAIYRHFRSLGVKRLNFLLPEVTHDSRRLFYGDPGPRPVAKYLIPIFDEWWAEDDPDIHIKLFHEVIKIILGGVPNTDTLGNSLFDYLVIDTDGSIHGNDCLKITYEGASETGLNVLEYGFEDLRKGNPLIFQLMNEGMPLCQKCLSCSELDICGGGPVTQRYSRSNGFLNPSVWCEDLLEFLRHIKQAVVARVGTVYATSNISQ